MSEWTAEKFAQRIIDVGLVDGQQLEAVWSEFGTREVPAEEFINRLVRKELLTNFQLKRLEEGKRDGYFYGDYKVLYLVGAGTFARVYRAVHRHKGDRQVAVKVLRQRYAEDMLTRDRFMREARMVMRLRHPNVVPIFDVQEERGRPFMVMEFVEGWNLRDFSKVRRVTLTEALKIISDVAAGLEHAFQLGITHRDMKLSNVLLTSTGRAKIVDFGLAAIAESEENDALGGAARSIDYAGLERCTGVRRNDPRSDIFFVGSMLYHLLAGRSPLYETRDRIQRLSTARYRDIKPLSDAAPDLPLYVIALVNKAMEVRPERRYQTPSEMLSDLRTAIKRVEAGDMGSPDEPVAETAANDPQDMEQDVSGRTVMIIESKIEIQNVLRERLKKRGYRVLVISDPERALERFDDPTAPADCVVFCTNELGQRGLEAFNQFANSERTKDIPAVLLVAENQQSFARFAALAEHRVMLSMPLKVRELRATLLKLLSQPSNTPK